MGFREFLEKIFGGAPLRDPVTESEAQISQICTLGPWVTGLIQQLDRRSEAVIMVKTQADANRYRLQQTRSGLEELKDTVIRHRQVTGDALRNIESLAGSVEAEPDPVPQDVIDQHGETLRELQEGQIAAVDKATEVIKGTLGEMQEREQNIRNELAEVSSKIGRLTNVEQTLATEENTIAALKKDVFKFAALSKVSPPKDKD